jgi:hypothetical protein
VIAAEKSAEGIVGRPSAERRPERWRGKQNGDLVRDKRQNIQLELAFTPGARGEASSERLEGTEARAARTDFESQAVTFGPSMEDIVERDNLKKALAQVKRNKGAPGIDGMNVDELGFYLTEHWPLIRARCLTALTNRNR